MPSQDEAPAEREKRWYKPQRVPPTAEATWSALLALASTGTSEHEPLLQSYADGDDELLSEHARWAMRSLRERLRREPR